jgi:hypothetical protein
MRANIILVAFSAVVSAAPVPEVAQNGQVEQPTVDTRVASIDTAANKAQG